MTLLRSLLSLALAAVTTPLLADTVWLKNGDKLTGSIELFDSGKLLLKTDYAGTITLDAGKIATLESERELLIKQGDFVGERAKSLRAAGQGALGIEVRAGRADLQRRVGGAARRAVAAGRRLQQRGKALASGFVRSSGTAGKRKSNCERESWRHS